MWRAPGPPTSRRSTPATPTQPRRGRQSRGPAPGAGGCGGRAGRLPAGDRLRPPRPGPAAASTSGSCSRSRGMWRAPGRPTSRRSTPATPTQAPTAALNLGILLEEQGDVEGARAAYQQAIDSGHADTAPDGGAQSRDPAAGAGGCGGRAGRLPAGDRLRPRRPGARGGGQPRGPAAGAGGCGGRAGRLPAGDRLRPPRHGPAAALNLGVLLQEQGDVAGARAAYQQAIDSGHADDAPMAAVNLGILLAGAGGCGGRAGRLPAGDRLRPRRRRPNGGAQPRGPASASRGTWQGARAAYQQAIDSGHPEQAPRPHSTSGPACNSRGCAGARAAYQQAIDSGHPEIAPVAARKLKKT